MGSDKEDSDWQELYENAEMEYKSGIEIMLEKAGPFEYLKVEGVKEKEGGEGLVSLKTFEPIFEELEPECSPLTIVEQEGTTSGDASDVLNRDDRQWRGTAGSYFIIDLGCPATVDTIDVDNRMQDGDFTKVLDVYAGESKLGPWTLIYYALDLKPDPNFVLEIDNPGPYRFLKVESLGTEEEGNWVGFYYFYPNIHRTEGECLRERSCELLKFSRLLLAPGEERARWLF